MRAAYLRSLHLLRQALILSTFLDTSFKEYLRNIMVRDMYVLNVAVQ